jgi:flagella basal body P-ring formation protein FlgA
MMLFLAIAAALPGPPPCAPVEGERIVASDLARLDPAFAALPAALRIGFAPVPGVRRTISGAHIARIARQHGIEGVAFRDVCFEYAVKPLAAGAALAAMRASLAGARIEIVELSRVSVPSGVLVFPADWLGGGAGDLRLWRGELRYGERRSLPVWARVKIAIEAAEVVAARDLPAGATLAAGDLAVRTVSRPPDAARSVAAVDDALGRRLRRALGEGQPVAARNLAAARDVEAGQTVRVEVASGAAKLKLDAVAETGGARGSRIVLRNPASGRRFTARIEGKGKAVVVGPAGGVSR